MSHVCETRGSRNRSTRAFPIPLATQQQKDPAPLFTPRSRESMHAPRHASRTLWVRIWCVGRILGWHQKVSWKLQTSSDMDRDPAWIHVALFLFFFSSSLRPSSFPHVGRQRCLSPPLFAARVPPLAVCTGRRTPSSRLPHRSSFLAGPLCARVCKRFDR